jgi:hypothetical protein
MPIRSGSGSPSGVVSLDVDVFAYLSARDWNHFLEVQEQLLFNVTEIVSRCGTSIASRRCTSRTGLIHAAPRATGSGMTFCMKIPGAGRCRPVERDVPVVDRDYGVSRAWLRRFV